MDYAYKFNGFLQKPVNTIKFTHEDGDNEI